MMEPAYLTECPHCGYVAVYYGDMITHRVRCEIDRSRGILGCGRMITLTRPNAIQAIWKEA